MFCCVYSPDPQYILLSSIHLQIQILSRSCPAAVQILRGLGQTVLIDRDTLSRSLAFTNRASCSKCCGTSPRGPSPRPQGRPRHAVRRVCMHELITVLRPCPLNAPSPLLPLNASSPLVQESCGLDTRPATPPPRPPPSAPEWRRSIIHRYAKAAGAAFSLDAADVDATAEEWPSRHHSGSSPGAFRLSSGSSGAPCSGSSCASARPWLVSGQTVSHAYYRLPKGSGDSPFFQSAARSGRSGGAFAISVCATYLDEDRTAAYAVRR